MFVSGAEVVWLWFELQFLYEINCEYIGNIPCLGCVNDCPAPSRTDVKNKWSSTYTPHIPSCCIQGKTYLYVYLFLSESLKLQFKFIHNDRLVYIFMYFTCQNFWLSWWIILVNQLFTKFISLTLRHLRSNLFTNVARIMFCHVRRSYGIGAPCGWKGNCILRCISARWQGLRCVQVRSIICVVMFCNKSSRYVTNE